MPGIAGASPHTLPIAATLWKGVIHMEEIDHKAARLELEKMLADLGAVYEIAPIPARTDGSEFNKDAAHYRYSITIGKGSQHYTTWGEFTQGWGNYSKHVRGIMPGLWYHGDAKEIISALNGNKSITIRAAESLERTKVWLAKKHPPKLVQIVSCLLIDAAGSDQPFAEWAGDLGYSDDSIKAKAIWEKCNDIRRWLERAIPSDKLARAYDLAAFM
jgi:hypothetical protein